MQHTQTSMIRAKNPASGSPGRDLKSLLRLERIAGVEPVSSAWEAKVLPINYIRILNWSGRMIRAVRGTGMGGSVMLPDKLYPRMYNILYTNSADLSTGFVKKSLKPHNAAVFVGNIRPISKKG